MRTSSTKAVQGDKIACDPDDFRNVRASPRLRVEHVLEHVQTCTCWRALVNAVGCTLLDVAAILSKSPPRSCDSTVRPCNFDLTRATFPTSFGGHVSRRIEVRLRSSCGGPCGHRAVRSAPGQSLSSQADMVRQNRLPHIRADTSQLAMQVIPSNLYILLPHDEIKESGDRGVHLAYLYVPHGEVVNFVSTVHWAIE